MSFADGSVYEGGWQKGLFHGQATLKLASGQSGIYRHELIEKALNLPQRVLSYQGQFVEGVGNGLAMIDFDVTDN